MSCRPQSRHYLVAWSPGIVSQALVLRIFQGIELECGCLCVGGCRCSGLNGLPGFQILPGQKSLESPAVPLFLTPRVGSKCANLLYPPPKHNCVVLERSHTDPVFWYFGPYRGEGADVPTQLGKLHLHPIPSHPRSCRTGPQEPCRGWVMSSESSCHRSTGACRVSSVERIASALREVCNSGRRLLFLVWHRLHTESSCFTHSPPNQHLVRG